MPNVKFTEDAAKYILDAADWVNQQAQNAQENQQTQRDNYPEIGLFELTAPLTGRSAYNGAEYAAQGKQVLYDPDKRIFRTQDLPEQTLWYPSLARATGADAGALFNSQPPLMVGQRVWAIQLLRDWCILGSRATANVCYAQLTQVLLPNSMATANILNLQIRNTTSVDWAIGSSITVVAPPDLVPGMNYASGSLILVLWADLYQQYVAVKSVCGVC